MKQPLTLTAIGVMLLIAVRAAHQAITIDEATTYVLFAQNKDPFHWLPSANNHLLNTLGMRLATTLFGVSEFTARLPALLGAALYIATLVRLCRLLTSSAYIQVIAFLCLTINPFLLDHLVAGRGYGMALGFLLLAITAYWDCHLDPRGRSPVALWVLISTSLALCFTASFTFAFVVAIAFVALLYQFRRQLTMRLLAAAILPAAAIALLIPSQLLLDWPPNQLYFGANSLAEMYETIEHGMLFDVNPELVNPRIAALFREIKPNVIPFAAATAALCFLWLFRSPAHPNFRLARLLSLIATATLAAHLVAFYAFGLLLPRDRTGIYFVMLLALAMAAVIASPPANLSGRWFRGAAIAAQVVLAAYFGVCLRTDYFEEWIWNSESDRVYSVLACLHQRDGLDRVAGGWHATSVLNFYRAADPNPTFGEVRGQETNPPDTQAYAIDPYLVPGVIEAKHLTVIYKPPITDTRIAVPPEYASLANSSCLQLPRPRTAK